LHFACSEIEQVVDFAAVAGVWNERRKVLKYRYTSEAASLFSSKNPAGAGAHDVRPVLRFG
jgi:hypothetical protein